MRILLSNDDGIHAPGLKALEKIARALSDDVWVVAPETEQSGASHSLTLTSPLRIREVSARRFAIQGTPTDCVMLALRHILPGHSADLVLSGVNRGANISEDVTYSGTVAAAMEGTLLGVPSIALSLAQRPESKTAHWSTAEHHAPGLIARLLEIGWPKDVLINVNFPDLPQGSVRGVDVTLQGRRKAEDLLIDERIDQRGVPYYWLGLKGSRVDADDDTDLKALREGRISVTPLHLDLTHGDTYRKLVGALEKDF